MRSHKQEMTQERLRNARCDQPPVRPPSCERSSSRLGEIVPDDGRPKNYFFVDPPDGPPMHAALDCQSSRSEDGKWYERLGLSRPTGLDWSGFLLKPETGL
jgi:hypothetical protein